MVNLAPELQQFEALEIAMGTDTLTGRLERQALDNAVTRGNAAIQQAIGN